MNNTPSQIYSILYNYLGPQYWWPIDQKYHQRNSSDPRFEIMIGAILTQNTAWSNVEKAIQNLKEHNILSIRGIFRTDEKSLAELIRPSGYFNQKAKRLRYLASYFHETYRADLDHFFSKPTAFLRRELLKLHGIGAETTDSILLYAGNKPIFVVDTYTKRICKRIPFDIHPTSYDNIQQFFQNNLSKSYNPGDLVQVYNEFHALLVYLGKQNCKTKPICTDCPLINHCHYGQQKKE